MGHDCSLVGKMVRTKIGDVSEILSSDEIGIKEKEELMQIFKDIAYQWCSFLCLWYLYNISINRYTKEAFLN